MSAIVSLEERELEKVLELVLFSLEDSPLAITYGAKSKQTLG